MEMSSSKKIRYAGWSRLLLGLHAGVALRRPLFSDSDFHIGFLQCNKEYKKFHFEEMYILSCFS